MKMLSAFLAASLLATPIAFADTNHNAMEHSNMGMTNAQMETAVHAKATINSIGENSANVSHAPIPEIGWPAMTMDLDLAPSFQAMDGASEGAPVTLMLVKNGNGMYVIGAIMPE
jgi:Cu/Ag efflux protein CusF